MSKLSLGPIVKTEAVRLTVALPKTLKADLERYAQLHAQTWGGEPMEAVALIPHILATFLERDRGFKRSIRINIADKNRV